MVVEVTALTSLASGACDLVYDKQAFVKQPEGSKKCVALL